MDVKSEAFKSALSAVRERIAAVKRRGTRRGFIDYRGCMDVCADFNKIIDEAEETLNAGEYEPAYTVTALIIINCAKIAGTADSSSGCLTDTIYFAQKSSRRCAPALKMTAKRRNIFLKKG